MSTLLFGSYYTYDNPAALHDQLADHLKLGKVRSSCREGRQPTRLTVLATASALATTAYPLVARSIAPPGQNNRSNAISLHPHEHTSNSTCDHTDMANSSASSSCTPIRSFLHRATLLHSLHSPPTHSQDTLRVRLQPDVHRVLPP